MCCMTSRLAAIVVLVILVSAGNQALGQLLQVTSVVPAQNAINVPVSTNIVVQFNMVVDTFTLSNSTFVVYGSHTGWHIGAMTADPTGHVITFNPFEDFVAGEVVTVILTTGIWTYDYSLNHPYIWTFVTKAERGLGSLIPADNYAVGFNAYSVCAPDLDGDGDLDLAVCGGSGSMAVLINPGDGTYSLSGTYTTGSVPTSIVAADLDRDGDMDLATANWNANSFSVFDNLGSGTFGTAVNYPVGLAPASIIAADLNGDGWLDLVTANRMSGNVSISLNLGDGSFGTPVAFASGSLPRSVCAADFNKDWDLDLAVANQGADSVSMLVNTGNAVFYKSMDIPVGSQPMDITAANLDEDPFPDFVTANYASGNVTVIYRDTLSYSLATYAVGGSARSVVAVDIDGDQDPDLVTANYDSDTVSVLLDNNFDGFTPASHYSVGSGPFTVCAGDLDNDGDMDLAVANYYSADVTVLFPMPLIVVAYGPVNILIEDPLGLQYGKDSTGFLYTEISPADYVELGDRDSCVIFEPLLGEYTISFSKALPKGSMIDYYAAIIKIDGTQETTVVAEDNVEKASRAMFVYTYRVEEGYHYINGDANRDESVNVGDAVYVINYVFKSGPAPYPIEAGDANCDHNTNVGDAVYIINFVFKSGNKPCCCSLCGDLCL